MKTQKIRTAEGTDSTVVKPNPTEETEKKTSKKTASHLWKNVLVGGVPGILIGTLTGTAIPPSGKEDDDNSEPNPHNEYDIHEAHSVNDDMSFSEAFSSARNEIGPGGAFVWHGHVYGTYRGDDPEWLEMTPEERAVHSQQILSQVHAGPYTPGPNEPLIKPDFNSEPGDELEPEQESDSDSQSGDELESELEPEEPESGDELEPEQEPDSDSGNEQESEFEEPGDELEPEEPESGEVDVHIVGVGQVQSEDGETIDVAVGQVDGSDAMFADTDGDGEVDTVLIDSDGDGVTDEVLDAEGSGMMMDDLAQQAEMNNIDTPDDHLCDDMPDYTNDGDVSSLI